MFSKAILTAATVLTVAAALAPSVAQARTPTDGPLIMQHSRDLLPNHDRAVNGSTASTPGDN